MNSRLSLTICYQRIKGNVHFNKEIDMLTSKQTNVLFTFNIYNEFMDNLKDEECDGIGIKKFAEKSGGDVLCMLPMAFNWGATKEGRKYWKGVHDMIVQAMQPKESDIIRGVFFKQKKGGNNVN